MRLGLVGFAVLIVVGILAATASIAAAVESNLKLNETAIVKLPFGDGKGQIARGSTPQQLFPGPLFDVEDGSVFVMDRMKYHLLRFDAQGTLASDDSLPSEVRLDAPTITDFRAFGEKMFWLVQDAGNIQAFTFDPGTRQASEIYLKIPDEMKPKPEEKPAELFKLAVHSKGLFLLNRLTQQSLLIYDTAPVPPQEQTWKTGMPVGGDMIRWGLPYGPITSVNGDALVKGDQFFFAAGDSCVLVSPKEGGESTFLELFNVKRGMVGFNSKPKRERGAVINMGARYRIEGGGYYEMYFEPAGVTISRWARAKG